MAQQVDQLIITNKVLKFGQLVMPLRSIVEVEAHRLHRSHGFTIVATLLLLGVGFAIDLAMEAEGGIFALTGLVSFFVILSRLLRKRKYVLRIQSTTRQENFWQSTDQAFLEEIVEEITEAMSNDEVPIQVVANIRNKTINKTSNETVMGDKFSANEASHVNLVKNTGQGNIQAVGEVTAGDQSPVHFGDVRDSYQRVSHSPKAADGEPSTLALKKELKALLADGKLEQAADQLLHHFQQTKKTDALKAVIVNKSRLSQIQMEETLGIAVPTDAKLHRTQVVAALVDLIDREMD